MFWNCLVIKVDFKELLLSSDTLKSINFVILGIIDLIVGSTGVRDFLLTFLSVNESIVLLKQISFI